MKNLLIILSTILIVIGCSPISKKTLEIESPNKAIKVVFNNEDDKLVYSVYYNNEEVIAPSKMGYEFSKLPPIYDDIKIEDFVISHKDDIWEQPWGEDKYIADRHNSVKVFLREKGNMERRFEIIFKVFNDGFAFKYILPKQDGIDSIFVEEEITEFKFKGSHKAWYIPAYHMMKYEILYDTSNINNLDTAHTPLTMKAHDSLYFSIHEAALTNFPSMTLYGNEDNIVKVDLVPWKDGIKVKANKSMNSSWRTVQIASSAKDLLDSRMILNLNEPNVLGNVSWVKPMKYVGIWWGMHIGIWSFYQGEKHGATTKRAMEYIDFASENGFDEVLVEGWNEGWTRTWGSDFGKNMNFTKPTPDFDLHAVQDYAKSRNVSLQAYNETCANSINYLSQIDSAFKLYNSLGYKSVKVGQVNDKLVNGEWHHGQYGVKYYQTVVEKGAEYKLAINFHEPIKPTGLRRTYPNLVSREGARGQEFNAWDSEGGNPPEHTCILPFTRLLAGPMDFTPGIFNISIPQRPNNQVNTTLAKQLALYVVIYSPIQMAADLIENYEGHPAFQFIIDVPVDWEKSKTIDAAIGDYVIITRKDKHSGDWYLGAITDEKAREFEIKLDFLEKGKKYEAQIYSDSEKSDYKVNPMEYQITTQVVDSDGNLSLKLTAGGGNAIRFKQLD